MINLYDKTGESFIGNLDECISCNVTEVRNGIFEVRLVYPAMRVISNNLIKENILRCKANDTLLNQKFRIFNVKKKHSNTIEVIARHISFDLLYDFIEDISIVNQSCEYALNTIFRNSQFSKHYRGHSDIINAQDYNMSMANCLNAIVGKEGSIVDTYGTGPEILRNNENIHVLNRRGHDNGVTIEYGKNLEGFECIEDNTDLVTRIYPFTKRSTSEGEVTITLDEKFVDSPKINLYSHPYIREIDLTHKFKDDEEISQDKLRKEARKYFIETKCDVPKLTFNLNLVPLSKCVGFEEDLGEKLSLCDVVTIKHKIYGITTQSKVIRTVFNVLTDRYEKIQLGEPKASLGELIGGGSNNTPQVGPPGPQGPPGADGNIGDFPDTLPAIPQLTADVLGFASVDLSWTFENKIYYSYQVFASKEENFSPNMFDLIFEGQASSFLHQVKPNEIWYYRARAINTHGKATKLSSQVKVITKKIDDMSNYFEEAAIGKAVVESLTTDYMKAGIIKGHWIDAKNLSVTDGNGKRTLDIDSYGNVNLDVTSLNIRSKSVMNADDTNKKINEAVTNYKKEVNCKFEQVNKSHDDLENTMNGAFKDGILTEVEKNELEKQLDILEMEKIAVISKVDELMSYKELENTKQLKSLRNAKANYIEKYFVLINNIREKIGLSNLEPPIIPDIDVYTDIVLYYPHFCPKVLPAYPDLSLLQNHNGEVYMFDCGETVSQEHIKKYLNERNIYKIDKLFVTHSHSDHIQAASWMMEQFKIKELYCKTPDWNRMPEIELNEWKTKEYHEKMINKAKELGIPIIELNTDRTITLSTKSRIKVYNSTNQDYSNYNSISLGFLFEYDSDAGKKFKYFIAADMSYNSENHVGGQNIGKVDVLKLGHHGNTGSNGEVWLGHLKADMAVATTQYPPGNQVKQNSMRCMFVGSDVYLPNDNPNFMHIKVDKKTGVPWTSAIKHRIISEWYKRDNGDWYYFKANGEFAKNESLIINGLKYHFNSNGLCINPGGESFE